MTTLAYAFVVLALLCVLVGSASYVVAQVTTAGRKPFFTEWGRHGFRMAALMTGLASIYLFYFFINNHFELDYIFHNSSRDLPLIFRISSFWAGQEGSFLLWAIWTGVLGLILIRTAGEDEASVMPFFGLTFAFILAMVSMINPFKVSVTPRPDGNGLNPLLQDYWMAIHPPTLFLGFALMAVPFAYAMGALWRREYRGWIRAAGPWTIMAVSVLALALSMGGHWAYRTLGWGGFWGWDPVENASLVPLLCGIALLHGLYLQRGLNAAGQRMNIGLAITGFVTVMYASYLTRSGVLTQFSNHSFSALPQSWFLLAALLFFVALGYGWLLLRYRSVPSPKAYDSLTSREFGFYLSVVMSMIAAALVAVGTSTPILTGWFGKPSTVQGNFYNWTMAPVGFLMAAMLAVYPLAARDGIAGRDLLRRLGVPLALAIAAALAVGVLGRNAEIGASQNAAARALTFGAVLALSLNAAVLMRTIRAAGVLATGGYLAHIGFGVLLLGIVCSSIYSRTKRINVPMNGAASALGYQFSLNNRGESPDATHTVIPLDVTAMGRVAEIGRRTFKMRPSMAKDRNGMQMTSPGIHSHPLYDLYVAPVEFDPGSFESLPITLKPGQVYAFGPLKLYFDGVTQIGEPGTPDYGMRANLLAIRGKEHLAVGPEINFQTERGTIVALPGGSRINVDPATKLKNGVTFDLIGPNSRRADSYIVVDVTVKPLIWLTWLGMVTTVVGGLMSCARRVRDNRRAIPATSGTQPAREPAGVR